ncbi:MAG: cytochrome C oxidase Cbb3 [Crocinitomicaceae bacterium]|jgi:hypothetical protein|nr:cytochrome C oxidase Cbb3 [Crocinitomicaceae bacterium]
MNWGKGIIVTMAAFMSFILFMVFTLLSKNTDLESEDYYKKEIEYEQEMNALSNASRLKEKVSINSNNEYLVLQFPTKEKISNIEIELFRPDNEKDDQTISENTSKTIMIAKNKLKKGRYNIAINYQIKGEKILQKEELMID